MLFAKKESPRWRAGSVLISRSVKSGHPRLYLVRALGARAMGNVVPLPSRQQTEGGAVDYMPPLVPAGRYSVRFIGWFTSSMFNRGKLTMRFTICDQGPYFEMELRRYFNVKTRGKQGPNGLFNVSWSSNLLREFMAVTNAPERSDRIPLSKLKPLLLIAEVETVTKSREQEDLHVTAQYSVVRQLLRAEAGNI
jgi:hypothetical protein